MDRTEQQVKELATEILEDIIDHYSEDTDRRSLNEGGICVFTNDDGCHCAFGRYMTPEHQRRDIAHRSISVDALVDQLDGTESHDDLLRPEYRGLALEFWLNTQHLHHDHWDHRVGHGLTHLGETRVAELREEIESGYIV